MPTIREILQEEGNRESGWIVLFLEGKFWKAYERSAYVLTILYNINHQKIKEMKAIKLLFFSLICLMAMNLNAQSYVDLGLSSGTKWKSANEQGFYSYGEAISTFGNSVPSKEQWWELEDECDWTWTGSGYKVVGPNGNSIVLPAAGYRDCNGGVDGVGTYGSYWSSTPYDSEIAWYLDFGSSGVSMHDLTRCFGFSVRLVQGK